MRFGERPCANQQTLDLARGRKLLASARAGSYGIAAHLSIYGLCFFDAKLLDVL